VGGDDNEEKRCVEQRAGLAQ